MKLIQLGGVWRCVDCGAPLETQDMDASDCPIAWVTHEPDCPAVTS